MQYRIEYKLNGTYVSACRTFDSLSDAENLEMLIRECRGVTDVDIVEYASLGEAADEDWK